MSPAAPMHRRRNPGVAVSRDLPFGVSERLADGDYHNWRSPTPAAA